MDFVQQYLLTPESMTEFFTYIEGPKPDLTQVSPIQALKDYIEYCGGDPDEAIVHFDLSFMEEPDYTKNKEAMLVISVTTYKNRTPGKLTRAMPPVLMHDTTIKNALDIIHGATSDIARSSGSGRGLPNLTNG